MNLRKICALSVQKDEDNELPENLMYIRVSPNQGQCSEILLLTNWSEIFSPDLDGYSHSPGILLELSPGFAMFCATGEFPVSTGKNYFGR